LDARRDQLQREIVGVAGEDAGGEPEPMSGDGRVERRAARPDEVSEAIERDVPDRHEIRSGHLRNYQAGEKSPAARRHPRAARGAYCLYVERAAEGANDADGPFSPAWVSPTCARR